MILIKMPQTTASLTQDAANNISLHQPCPPTWEACLAQDHWALVLHCLPLINGLVELNRVIRLSLQLRHCLAASRVDCVDRVDRK